jgi:hypothetical protein
MVNLTANISAPAGLYAIDWSFNQGDAQRGQNVSIRIANEGFFWARATVRDALGRRASDTLAMNLVAPRETAPIWALPIAASQAGSSILTVVLMIVVIVVGFKLRKTTRGIERSLATPNGGAIRIESELSAEGVGDKTVVASETASVQNVARAFADLPAKESEGPAVVLDDPPLEGSGIDTKRDEAA